MLVDNRDVFFVWWLGSGETKMKQESFLESSSDSSDSNSALGGEDGSSDVSDLDKFEEACEEFGKSTAGVDTVVIDRHLAGNKSDDVSRLSLEGELWHGAFSGTFGRQCPL